MHQLPLSLPRVSNLACAYVIHSGKSHNLRNWLAGPICWRNLGGFVPCGISVMILINIIFGGTLHHINLLVFNLNCWIELFVKKKGNRKQTTIHSNMIVRVRMYVDK